MIQEVLILVLALIASERVFSASTEAEVEKQREDAKMHRILFGEDPKVHECLTTNATVNHPERKYDNEPAWTVVLFREEKFFGRTLNIQQCSGSLIHPQVVLTAAHCIYKKSLHNLKIRAGECKRVTNHKSKYYQERRIESADVISAYDPKKPKQDIALLFLNAPLNITTHVKTVCLPPADVQLDLDYVRCYATGWQRMSHISPGYENFRKINMTVIPRENCENALQLTGLGENFTLHRSLMCAGGALHKSVLDVNGGAPLVCSTCGDTSRTIQIGVLSWGFSASLLPELFTEVRSAQHWIKTKLDEKGMQLPTCGIKWKQARTLRMDFNVLRLNY